MTIRQSQIRINLYVYLLSTLSPLRGIMKKRTMFFVEHPEEGRLRWFFWRDTRRPAAWILKTHDGCERELEANWQNSLPLMLQVVENYGCTSQLS